MNGRDLLTALDVIPYLLQRNLLLRSELTGGTLQLREAHRRNRNFRVHRERGPGLFVKQAPATGASLSIANEARVLACARKAGGEPLRYVTSSLLHYDEARAIVVTELLAGESLAKRTQGSVAPTVPACRALGTVLGGVHELGKDDGSSHWGLIESRPPDLFDALLWPRLASLGQLSSGQLEYVRLIQGNPELSQALSDVQSAWSGKQLVHMDFRWDNGIVEQAESPLSLKLVDWETGGWGDPAWDLGCVFASFLADWVLSIREQEGAEPAEVLSASRYSLEDVQPALRGFWEEYREKRSFASSSSQLLLRSARMCGARLCQTAFETLQQRDRCTAGTYRLTQVALNVLNRPMAAAIHLFGVPVDGADLE